MKVNVTELSIAVKSLLMEATTPKELDDIAYAIKRVVENEIDDAQEQMD